jgi:hypothetical protein
MQSTELRELTASEELTLEQEYAMQRELPNLPTHVPLIKPVARRGMEVNRKLAGGRGQCVALPIALILLRFILILLLALCRTHIHHPRPSARAHTEQHRAHERRY